MKRVIVFALALAAACSDALEQTSSAGQLIGVAGIDTLSLIPAVGSSPTTIDLAASRLQYGTVWLAGHESVLLIVHEGLTSPSRVTVVDLAAPGTIGTTAFALAGTAAGPPAIQDDSIAWVPVYDLSPSVTYSVARVDYRTHTATRTTISGSPGAAAFTAGHVFLVASNNGSSWIAVVDTERAAVVDSIPLTAGGGLVVGGDSLLYVIGSEGTGGEVSIVDPVAGQELVVIKGLSPPTPFAVFHPSGRLLVAADTAGILEVNTLTRSISRGPGHGVKPGGHGVLALALDNGGRVYALDANCAVVHVLAPPPDYGELRTVDVAGCPLASAVATRP